MYYLWDYQDKFVINFMDDILIYSPDFESHIQQVLNKLKESSLNANPEKCTWCAMPHPDILFDKLKGAKYFTKLDLSQGFHQLRLTQEDRAKSAITTRYGNFEWTVASFGMSNVPSVVSQELWETYFGTIKTNS